MEFQKRSKCTSIKGYWIQVLSKLGIIECLAFARGCLLLVSNSVADSHKLHCYSALSIFDSFLVVF